MLEQMLKSSGLLDVTQKLHMDFKVDPSIGSSMTNEDEIDPIRLRTALFALMTAKLEDAHETAVKCQSTKLNTDTKSFLITTGRLRQ